MKRKITIILILAFAALVLTPAAVLAANPVLNLQLNLLDSSNNALAGYVVTLDNDTQSIANADGSASFGDVDASIVHTLKVFTPDKSQIGECNLTFVQADSTGIGAYTGNGNYQIDYATPNVTIYIDIVADPKGNDTTGCHPAAASDTPLTPGNTPSPAPAPTAEVTDPVVRGYLVDQNSRAISGATIQSTNNDTGETLSCATGKDGSYYLRGMAEGRHTLSAYAQDGSSLGSVSLLVQAGAETEFAADGSQEDITVQTGLGTLYMNLQSDGSGQLTVLDVSENSLSSPVRSGTTPTAGSAATESPAATPPAGTGLPSTTTIIIIVVIIAAAAIIIALIVVRNRRSR